jgi:hypothetical protein
MKRTTTIYRTLAITTAACLLCITIAQAKKPPKDGGGTRYDLVVLAPLGTNTYSSTVGDLRENGKIVGSFENVKDNPRAFYFDVAAEKYTTLSGGTIALGINDSGNIVGGDWDAGHAMYWDSFADDPVTLSPLPGDIEAIAGGINDTRMVCGRSIDDSFFWRGVAWQIDANGNVGSPVELPPLAGDDISHGVRINEPDAVGNALITGYSGIKAQRFTSDTAVLWEVGLDANGVLQLLAGPVGLGTIGGGYSLGYSVNKDGDVCGESENWPFIAVAGSSASPLPGLDNSVFGNAADLNDVGQIVGALHVKKNPKDPQPDIRAMLWENGQVIDLSKRVSLGRFEKIENAGEINNDGLITGDGTLLDFKSEGGAYLLIPK